MKLLILLLIFGISPFVASAQIATITQPIRILIVPGHDGQSFGAQYGNIKEADMTLSLADEIYNILKKDKRFEVHITRNWQGYTKEFTDYFTIQKDAILAFKEKAKENTKKEIAKGTLVNDIGVPHVSVSPNVSLRLYGINKWVDENKMDVVLHIHFNDYPRPNKWVIGKYKGIAVYVPDKQMANVKESKSLGEQIYKELVTKYTVSNYEKEKAGVIEDQKLIATGARGTLDSRVRSILIEYGYIYQKIFRNTKTRHQAYKDMTGLTTKGIINYFFK